MLLYINDENVDFSLEQEKTLAEVILSLEGWLAKQKLLISTIRVNDEAYDKKKLEKSAALPIDKISELRLTACDFMEYERFELSRLAEYFTALQQAARTANQTALPALLDQLAERITALTILFPAANGGPTTETQAEIDKLFTGTTAGMIALWDAPTKTKAAKFCENLLEHISQRLKEYEHLDKSSENLLHETINKLRETVLQLGEVSILLQTGKDSQAMQTIITFSEMTQLFLKIAAGYFTGRQGAAVTADGASFENYSTALNTHLKELIEAFQKKDFILIGDLCEYEIAPKITVLIDFVEKTVSREAV